MIDVNAAVKLLDYLESDKCLIPGFDIPDDIYVPFRDSVRAAQEVVEAGEQQSTGKNRNA